MQANQLQAAKRRCSAGIHRRRADIRTCRRYILHLKQDIRNTLTLHDLGRCKAMEIGLGLIPRLVYVADVAVRLRGMWLLYA